MTCIINASTSNGIVSTADGSGVVKLQSNGVTTNALVWVNFGYVASSITVRAQYNVSSITRNGTGDYTINFTNATSDANYCITGSNSASGNGSVFLNGLTQSQTITTTSCRVGTTQPAVASVDSNYVFVAIFGN